MPRILVPIKCTVMYSYSTVSLGSTLISLYSAAYLFKNSILKSSVPIAQTRYTKYPPAITLPYPQT